MGLETGTYIDDLVVTNPTSTDLVKFGDDHLRLIKACLKNTFPNASAAINPSVTEFNYLVGVTSAIQTQLDAKLPNTGHMQDLAALSPSSGDGEFMVSTGAGTWQYETGNTARTSLGLGTGDSPTFANPTVTSISIGDAGQTLAKEDTGQINCEGQTMFSHGTGQVNANYASARVFMSDSAPTTEGSNGDIWFEY